MDNDSLIHIILLLSGIIVGLGGALILIVLLFRAMFGGHGHH